MVPIHLLLVYSDLALYGFMKVFVYEQLLHAFATEALPYSVISDTQKYSLSRIILLMIQVCIREGIKKAEMSLLLQQNAPSLQVEGCTARGKNQYLLFQIFQPVLQSALVYQRVQNVNRGC